MDYALLCLLFLAALLSKTVTCSLPATILLLIWWKRGRIEKRDVVASLPLFAIGFIMAMSTVWLERVHVAAEGTAWDYSPLERLLIASRAVWFYLAKLLLPLDLSFNYARWGIDSAEAWQYAFPIALLFSVIALYALRNKIGRGALIALLFFAGTLLPALGFFNVFPMRYSFVADHFQYLASLGPIVLLSAFATRFIGNRERAALAASAVLIATLSVLTWRQCHVYDGHLALWTDTLAKNPTSILARANLGKTYLDQGDFEHAAPHLEAALELDDSWFETHLNLGVVRAKQGRIEDARQHFDRAVHLKPDWAAGHNNLAWALNQLGDAQAALEHALLAVQLNPTYIDGHSTLADTYAKLGREEDAMRHMQTALQLSSNNPGTLLNAASVLAQVGRAEKATEAYVVVLRMLPGNEEARTGLVELFVASAENQTPTWIAQAIIEVCTTIPTERDAIMSALVTELTRVGKTKAADAVRAAQ